MATNNAINQAGPRPLFFAYLNASSGSITGDGTSGIIPYNTVLYDYTSSFNTGTYKFTAPTNGTYLVSTSFNMSNADTKNAMIGSIYFGANPQSVRWNPDTVSSGTSFVGNITLSQYMAAGTECYVDVQLAGGAKNCAVISGGAVDPKSWFTAYLIG